MQLDWTTFVLEIINFLILLWVLKHFLYTPVRAAIARRQAAVTERLEQAEARATEADALRQQYERRMQDWKQEREAARARLAEELAQEREARLADVRTALDAEREKARVIDERRARAQQQALAEQSAQRAAGFATQLLQRLSGPALDIAIAEMVIADLAQLDETQKARLETGDGTAPVEIVSAESLPDELLARLDAALRPVLKSEQPPTCRVDPQLIGGLRIARGPWVLEATLAHELEYFRKGLVDGA